jgi:DNA adenine methylase
VKQCCLAFESELGDNQISQPRPFVKWVGGKRSILRLLLERVPREYSSYHEPFLGGGAMFFAIRQKIATLSDVNRKLVLAYAAVRDDVDALIAALREHEKRHGKSHYLEARRRLRTETDPVAVGALLIYLNKTCFNGLYRVNKSGEFNVAMGEYESPPIVDEETLQADSAALQGVELLCQGFDRIAPTPNAFYYLDPPYHGTYDGYDGTRFGDGEHRKLAELCRQIDEVGGYFMLSNSDTALVRSLYGGYVVETVSASRSVSRDARGRGRAKELLVRNYE